MKHYKIVSIVLFAVMLASLPGSMARAAEGSSALVTGTIQSITLETDPATSTTTVVVFFVDDADSIQKARLSLETAITLGLVIPNPESVGLDLVIPDPVDPTLVLYSGVVEALAFVTDPITLVTTLDVTLLDEASVSQVVKLDLATALLLGLIVPNAAMIGGPIELDPADILESETYSEKVTLLFTVFGAALTLTPDQLAAYETETGFGVLAQALWITSSLGGDSALLDLIITAKNTSDFSAIVLPDGSTPANWGQLRKAALTDSHQNPGQIVSGKVEPLPAPTTVSPTTTVVDPDKTHGKSGDEHGKNGKKK
jgi:hypothetical protein